MFYTNLQKYKYTKKINNHTHLTSMLSVVLFFVIVYLTYSAEKYPDFESYKLIYDIGGINFAENSTGWAFVALIFAAKYVGSTYVQFRFIVQALSVLFFVISLCILSKKIKIEYSLIRRNDTFFSNWILISLGLLIFLIEFFQIRIRGGLALSLMIFGFSNLISFNENNRNKKLCFSIISLLLAYEIHAFTTIVLVYFLYFPLALSHIKNKILLSKYRSSQIFIFWSLVSFITFVFVYSVLIKTSERGENLASELNYFRFICISLIPLSIFTFEALNKRLFSKRHKKNNFQIQNKKIYFSWQIMVTNLYFLLSLCVAILFFSGYIFDSGEAIVRVLTLSSAPAIIIVLSKYRSYSKIWFYLLICNSLFFNNSVGFFNLINV